MRIYKFQNKRDHALRVYLEPWGDEFVVPPMADFTMDIFQPKAGLLETHLEESAYTVWLWGGCRVEVYINGEKQLRPWLSLPAPG